MAKYHVELGAGAGGAGAGGAGAEKIATRKSFGEALVKLAGKHGGIVVLDADLSCSVQTGAFAREYPERHFNMGIAEQNMMGAAAGFATRGKIPFACTFSVFATGRPWEIIRNSVCYPNLNVKILGSHAGILTGEDGASHQATEDIAIMRALPNMKVVQPADHFETLSVMERVVEDYGPTYIRVLRQATPVLYSGVRGGSGSGSAGSGFAAVKGDTPCDFKFGRADVLYGADVLGAKGRKADVCIFATGALVASSLEAAGRLSGRDEKSAIVVNVSSLKPLDEATVLECAGRSKVCVTAEDHNVIGGLGSAVAEVFAGAGLGVRLLRIGMEDRFGESGKPEDLYKKYGFDGVGVYRRVRKLL